MLYVYIFRTKGPFPISENRTYPESGWVIFVSCLERYLFDFKSVQFHTMLIDHSWTVHFGLQILTVHFGLQKLSKLLDFEWNCSMIISSITSVKNYSLDNFWNSLKNFTVPRKFWHMFEIEWFWMISNDFDHFLSVSMQLWNCTWSFHSN